MGNSVVQQMLSVKMWCTMVTFRLQPPCVMFVTVAMVCCVIYASWPDFQRCALHLASVCVCVFRRIGARLLFGSVCVHLCLPEDALFQFRMHVLCWPAAPYQIAKPSFVQNSLGACCLSTLAKPWPWTTRRRR